MDRVKKSADGVGFWENLIARPQFFPSCARLGRREIRKEQKEPRMVFLFFISESLVGFQVEERNQSKLGKSSSKKSIKPVRGTTCGCLPTCLSFGCLVVEESRFRLSIGFFLFSSFLFDFTKTHIRPNMRLRWRWSESFAFSPWVRSKLAELGFPSITHSDACAMQIKAKPD